MYNMVNTDVICPNCGEGHMVREEPKVITSNAERYAYLCPYCGFVHTARSDEEMKEWIKSLDKPIEEEILKEQVMKETKIQIGEDVLLDIGTHSEWYISTICYDGKSVDVQLRRKADKDKKWWLSEQR